MSQLAVVRACQIPFRFGLPSSVRPAAAAGRGAAPAARPAGGACPWPAIAPTEISPTTATNPENPLNPVRITSPPPIFTRSGSEVELRADSQQPWTQYLCSVPPRRTVCRGHAEHAARVENIVDIEAAPQPGHPSESEHTRQPHVYLCEA